ncbi:MAG: glycosyltransferase [Actinomycetota bacterium]|nr:glycosyltransferase [Actinomycetota bacterium]
MSARVAVVIVTFRRVDVMLQTLACVLRQTTPVVRVVVVDNDGGSDQRVRAEATALSDGVHYLALAGNLGPAAGFAAGLEWLLEADDPDWVWLLDDDSPPAPTSLASCLVVAAEAQAAGLHVGAVGNRGGHFIRGLVRHDLRRVEGGWQRADFVLSDGAIVSSVAVAAAGVPRRDLFIMFEDIEFTSRIRLAGFDVLVRPTDGSTFLHMGSTADWRGYYQARNHIRVALDLRQWTWLWGWVARETGIGLHLLRERRFAGLCFRWRGALDGLLGRMGKRVDPADPRLWKRRPPKGPR